MGDIFYCEYSKAIKNCKLWDGFKKQKIIGFCLWGIMTGFAVCAFVCLIMKKSEPTLAFMSIYAVFAIINEIVYSRFEREKRNSLFGADITIRRKCLLETIDKFFMKGKYDEKISFLEKVYEGEIEKCKDHEKSYRRVILSIVTSFGVILTNTLNSPENTLWQSLLTVVLAIIIIVGLTVAPLLYVKLFDPKKDEYSFMLFEIRAIRLVVQDDSNSCNTNSMMETTDKDKMTIVGKKGKANKK